MAKMSSDGPSYHITGKNGIGNLYKDAYRGWFLNYAGKTWNKFGSVGAIEAKKMAKRYIDHWDEKTKISNPLEKVSQGGWITAHAVRIRKGRLEILR